MKCPFCGTDDTQVVETRVSEDGDFVRRRRQCGDCDKRFTTYERPDVNFPVVVKKDGSRTDFDREQDARLDDAGAAQAPGEHRADRRRAAAHRAEAAVKRAAGDRIDQASANS